MRIGESFVSLRNFDHTFAIVDYEFPLVANGKEKIIIIRIAKPRI